MMAVCGIIVSHKTIRLRTEIRQGFANTIRCCNVTA
jgi:hypothetical protein